VLMELMRNGQIVECVCFAMNCAARLLGNRLGRRAEEKSHKKENRP